MEISQNLRKKFGMPIARITAARREVFFFPEKKAKKLII